MALQIRQRGYVLKQEDSSIEVTQCADDYNLLLNTKVELFMALSLPANSPNIRTITLSK